jgi:hypothetical protein
LSGVAAGALDLLLAGVLDWDGVAVFGLALEAGLALVAGLDVAFRDRDLVRLTVPARDLAFVLLLVLALLLVFAMAFALADFVFFLATMRASLLRTTASQVTWRRRQPHHKVA